MTRSGYLTASIALLASLAAAAAPAAKAGPAKAGPAKAAPAKGAPAKAAGAVQATPQKLPPVIDPTTMSKAPLTEKDKIAWSHAPYEEGNCAVCHESKDPKKPGKITMPVNELCYSCHEEFQTFMDKRSNKHPPAKKSCTNCHNPHNAPMKRLLIAEMGALCLGCHPDTRKDIETAAVPHLPVLDGAKCVQCHNPHASNVDRLLIRQPFDLCLGCHNSDDLKDPTGRPISNMKKWLDDNKQWHGPVQEKDCSACHIPHGSKNFRLLVKTYPPQFYSPYEPDNYALCFECHKSDIVKDKETTTLTRFRDGSRNLHYLHVNQPERGRTCRACHEVHGAHQPHIIRDEVPFGTRGWMLQINYTPSPTGGTCAKTCHQAKSYDNGGAPKVDSIKGSEKSEPAKK